MESWKLVWRETVPLLPHEGLMALRDALAADLPSLCQGATTDPPPANHYAQARPDAACLLGYCGWKGLGLETVEEVEEFFAATCYEIDQRLGEPASCRWLLNWFDETPREQMRRDLLAEVELALAAGSGHP